MAGHRRDLQPLVFLLAALTLVGACREDAPILRAYRAEQPNDLIGGDVAMTRVGDFILENDRIRLGILDVEPSVGPGVFGGTLVDADLQREDARFRNGNGHDQLAEVFPFANLLTPNPNVGDVEIVADGSDGAAAIVRVKGEGGFFLDALNVFLAEEISQIFGDIKVRLAFETDYILEPGKPYVRMVSRATRTERDTHCEENFACELDCEAGLRVDLFGCPLCECATEGAWPGENLRETEAIFFGLLGDAAQGIQPGVVLGDFVFFGAQNNLFAPGMGFDETRPVFDQLWEGADSFSRPLAFDFMAAAGGAVSYVYFTVNPAGEEDPRVLVPIITSSATAFVSSKVNCNPDAEAAAAAELDEGTDAPPACDSFRSVQWERYLGVGKGDIASAADIVFATRGTTVGTIEGTVVDAIYEPSKNGKVFLVHDPDPAREWSSVREVVDVNYRQLGEPGILNAIDADVGLDPVEDGDFKATMPPGDYLLVATNEEMTATSPVYRVSIVADEKTSIVPVVPAPASIRYNVTDAHGARLEAKLTLVALLEDGTMATLDGTRRPYLGEGRIGSGVRHLAFTRKGEGTLDVEPGRYRLLATHGPTYSQAVVDFEAESGRETVVDLQLIEEVSTDDWIGLDFHLHAEPSFDAGMKLDTRILTAAAEGLDLAVSSDHDVVTDYRPILHELELQDRMAVGIGVEQTTLENGHFIAFPLHYDKLQVPDHNAPEWACMDGEGLLAELDDHMSPGHDGVRIMCHPRDGFFGYIDQLEVDPFDLTRADLSRPKLDIFNPESPLALSGGNVLFRATTCDFEAMEVYNSKRFDLLRTPTNEEIVDFNRCMDRILGVGEGDWEALANICPEVAGADDVECLESERFFDCKMKHRRKLNFEVTVQMMKRTPEEQRLIWAFAPEKGDDDHCDASEFPDGVPDDVAAEPCLGFPGTVDDWFRWLDSGLNVSLAAASDSHNFHHEPGMPRTWVRSSAETPHDIDVDKVAARLANREAMPSYGPIVDVEIDGITPGQVATVTPGETFSIDLRVQTASWFGVDRIEVYVSGELQKVLNLGHAPDVIIDWDGPIELTAPATDGFVSVIVMGLEERNLFGPAYLDVEFGNLQIALIASLAFGAIPNIGSFFPQPALRPDIFPVFPVAMTNAILLDTNGDGLWTPANGPPAFCPTVCDPDLENPNEVCPDDQVCLSPERVCGYDIAGECSTAPSGLSVPMATLGE